MNIILMGYRCTGKTSVGRTLAATMKLPFYDTDALIERQTQRTIPQIVAERGWPAFREAERTIIGELAGVDHSVIALGGGAVLDVRNVESLKRKGLFVWLFAAAETIAARMEKDAAGGTERPSLTGKTSLSEMNAVIAEREPLYRSLADLVVDTTLIGTDRVAEIIQTSLRNRVAGADEVIKKKEK